MFVLVLACLALLVLIILTARRFVRSGIGVLADTIRHDPEVAEQVGLPTKQLQRLLVMLSSSTAAAAGALHAHFTGYVVPATFGLWHSITVFVIALAGWRRGIRGVVIACGVLHLVPESLKLLSFRIPVSLGRMNSLALTDFWPLVFAVLVCWLAFAGGSIQKKS